MYLNNNICDFLQKSAKLSDNHTLYLCDLTKQYAKVDKNAADFTESLNEININNVLKKYIKFEDVYITNCNNYNIMINKIYENIFLISVSNEHSFDEKHIEFAKTTVEFLKKMIKKEDS